MCVKEALTLLVRVSAAGFALKLTTERAAQQIAVTWYSKAHSLVQITNLDGLSCILGCHGLFLAFLCVACGTGMAFAAAVVMRKKQTGPLVETGCIGVAVFLGCGVAGAFLGSASMMLMTLGPRGLCLMGFLLSLTLHLVNKQQIVASPARMLVLPALTFITMYLGVLSGHVIDTDKPRLGLVHILLLPAGYVMGILAEISVVRKPSGYITLSFVLLTPLTGFLLGRGIESYYGESPLFYDTLYTLRTLVYTVEVLTGITGALLGGMSLSFWEAKRAGGLSLWISVPAAVMLYVLDSDTPHISLHSPTGWYLGAGGELGLTLGLAAASGVSLGLAIMSARELLWSCAVLILGIVFMIDDPDLLLFRNVGRAADAAQENQDSGHNASALLEAVVNFAVLGVVLMGATALGAAGFLTAALGSAGVYGVTLATQIIVMKAIDSVWST